MTLALGTRAPSFSLPGVDGATRALDDYADVDALAVVWSCNHCPYVQAWEDRMMAVQRDYGARGFRLVAINSNDAERYPADSFEAMQRRARERGFNFDYLLDEDQSVARAYGPERTPEVFLFDSDRRLVYHGAIDDSYDEQGVQVHYLRDALDALLDGREPPVAETPPVGCSVKWRN
ncbi:MAG: thioredoxin family protein [Thermoleophilia bacterium]|nr:thioredoxin family protein [Thermoleophilia bacterium]